MQKVSHRALLPGEVKNINMALGAAITFCSTVIYSGARPAAWTDLDIGAVIAALDSVTSLVLIKLTTASGTGSVFFKTNGDAETSYGYNSDGGYAGGLCSSAMGDNSISYVAVKTDANGVIEWKGENTNNITLTVIAYMR